jgi:alpha-tubulin suppressor-like RCC1 family protein
MKPTRTTRTSKTKSLTFTLVAIVGLSQSAHSAAPTVRVQRDGTNVALNFTGWLQSAGQVNGPYTNVVPAASSPYAWPVTAAPQQFWRAETPGLKTIAAGDSHTMAIKADGSLWAWGENTLGQLGLGTLANTGQPTRVGADTNWTAVACGFFHTAAIKADGSLWLWGDNGYGELGNGSFANTNLPARIGSETNWTTVACGYDYTMALKADGSLWGWGYNGLGMLGTGSFDSTNQPTRIDTTTSWFAVVCGSLHTVALRTDGSLWTWGDNYYAQLGNGTNGEFQGTNRPVRIGVDRNWMEVSCGSAHSVALNADGSLWAWGDNSFGEVGNGTNGSRQMVTQPVRVGLDTDWTAMSGGYSHTAAV